MLVTANGKTGYFYTGGKPFNPALPTIAFIHGAQHDHSVWALQSRYFAHHGWNVMAVDLPAHGRSHGPALKTVEQMAEWVLKMLDSVGVTKVMLVGHSMGSLIALEAAARAPERVTRLALLATAFPMKVSEVLLDAARDDEPVAIDMVNSWSHSGIAQKPSSPGPGFSVTGSNRRLMQRMAAGETMHLFHTDFLACNRYANGLAAAALVRCPTLVIHGDQDQMTPARASTALTAALHTVETLRIAECGHALMAEQPDGVLDALRVFVGASP